MLLRELHYSSNNEVQSNSKTFNPLLCPARLCLPYSPPPTPLTSSTNPTSVPCSTLITLSYSLLCYPGSLPAPHPPVLSPTILHRCPPRSSPLQLISRADNYKLAGLDLSGSIIAPLVTSHAC